MYKKRVGLVVLFMWVVLSAMAQTDTAAVNSSNYPQKPTVDSVALAKAQAYRDSVKAVGDSLSMIWLKAPDPNRTNPFLDSLVEVYAVKNLDFKAAAKNFQKKSDPYKTGKPLAKRERWVFYTILFLLVFFAILKNAFPKELEAIIQSFYTSRFSKTNAEDHLFSSWPFLFFYILFGLTLAMFLYLAGKYFQLEYNYSGFEWYLILAGIIVGLFAFKIIALRTLAFLFDLGNLVKQYTSLLFLGYFNVAIAFLPVVVAFSLTPYSYGEYTFYVAILMLAVILAVLFFRAASIILSEYQFSKVYLIIYLCALEICPLLILIKALRF